MGDGRCEEYILNRKSDYSVQRIENGAVVILNSNADKLEEEIQANQRQWYDSTLIQCNRDTSVRWIITVAHHSPFSNSDMVTGSEFIRNESLPAFYKSVKSKVWIGGHAHRFEHFRKKEKDFPAIGRGWDWITANGRRIRTTIFTKKTESSSTISGAQYFKIR